jgi:hypothetical protein
MYHNSLFKIILFIGVKNIDGKKIILTALKKKPHQVGKHIKQDIISSKIGYFSFKKLCILEKI